MVADEHIETFKPDRTRDIQRLLAAKELEKQLKTKLKRVQLLNGHAYSLDINKWRDHPYEANRNSRKNTERPDPPCGSGRGRIEDPGEFESSGCGEAVEEGY